MLNVRSRAGVIGVTAGATVLLAVPVVAFAQVPSVDQVVGDVNDGAQGVVEKAPAQSLPAPAQAPATKPAPRAPAQSRSAPGGSAPAQSHSAPPQRSSAQRSSGSSSSHAGGNGASSAHARAAETAPAAGGERHRRPAASDDKTTNAAPDFGDPTMAQAPATDVQIADGTVDAPRDASPGTLPFTGLQLALMAMLGLAAIAGGALLRRGARHPQA
jgi:hypothetical protein